ncbi:MAG: hypothetical protein M3Q07_10385, partial [Pseudobdellovibrionaceae bacterium]|nr:hypothetical protein [Pseudobdellovibrionaceae bacterium]
VFVASPAVQGLADTTAKAKAKTKLALDWLASLEKTLDLAENGPAVILADIMESAALTATGTTPLAVDSPVCKAVKIHFPGFQTRWTDKSLAVCFTAL